MVGIGFSTFLLPLVMQGPAGFTCGFNCCILQVVPYPTDIRAESVHL